MKNWIKNLFDDDVAIVLGIVNLLLVLITACIVKAFSGDVSTFAGCAFLVGFVAVVFEWIFCAKTEKAPAGATIGVLIATVFAYILGV